jgi:isocitrate dehydrogenase (NAD+)
MQASTEKVIPATLIAGDGIGPEIVEATLMVLDALGAPFGWEVHKAGMAGVEEFGDPLPQTTLDSVRRTRLALKGPLTTPVGGGYRSSNVRLREEFNLYANVRPARTLVQGGRYEDIDLVLVRENLEGLYVGFEHFIPIGDDLHAVAIGSGVNTRAGCRRIAEYAFQYAIRNGRNKVTIVHKANILKALSGLFLETAREVGKRYEGRLQVDERIVDACAMQLVIDPWQFDVIVTTNLFGDILSDEIAAIFEAVHGSAPDLAGKGIANPMALLLAAAMMLDHIGRSELAHRLRKAIDQTLNQDKVRTGDLGGTASTNDFSQAIVGRLKQIRV